MIREAEIFYDVFHCKPEKIILNQILSRQGFNVDRASDIVESKKIFAKTNYAIESQGLRKKTEKLSGIIRFLPFVRMVAICNAVAMGTADENSDIDLFVIVKKGRIFTARSFMTLFFHILRIRRYGNRIRGRFCLTFFVTDDSLDLKPIAIMNDIYLKYWLLTLQPIFNDGVFVRFCERNGMILENLRSVDKASWLSRFLENLFNGKVGNFMENRLKAVHLARWSRRKNEMGKNHGIIISDQMLKFHNIDMRIFFRNEFERKGGKYVKNPISG